MARELWMAQRLWRRRGCGWSWVVCGLEFVGCGCWSDSWDGGCRAFAGHLQSVDGQWLRLGVTMISDLLWLHYQTQHHMEAWLFLKLDEPYANGQAISVVITHPGYQHVRDVPISTFHRSLALGVAWLSDCTKVLAIEQLESWCQQRSRCGNCRKKTLIDNYEVWNSTGWRLSAI